jgi:hypothetical protein
MYIWNVNLDVIAMIRWIMFPSRALRYIYTNIDFGVAPCCATRCGTQLG